MRIVSILIEFIYLQIVVADNLYEDEEFFKEEDIKVKVVTTYEPCKVLKPEGIPKDEILYQSEYKISVSDCNDILLNYQNDINLIRSTYVSTKMYTSKYNKPEKKDEGICCVIYQENPLKKTEEYT